jgi:magnesium transporter
LRRPSRGSDISSQVHSNDLPRDQSQNQLEDYHINNPPSIPGSPLIDAVRDYADTVYLDQQTGDTIVDVDGRRDESPNHSTTPISPGLLKKRMTLAAEEDVCFPQDMLSEIAEEDEKREVGPESIRIHRRRRKPWPDLEILEAWRHEEKEEIVYDQIRARKVNEPLLVEGRLRPRKVTWHPEFENTPYRFTYFNEEFESTIHSQTISELIQPGQTFEDLFIPKPPIISDSSSEDEEYSGHNSFPGNDLDRKVSLNSTNQSSLFKSDVLRSSTLKSPSSNNYIPSENSAGRVTPTAIRSPGEKPKRYGPRPVFWLDVLQPTDAEMRLLSKAFGIHPLTTEDIMAQEEREKVELFRNYYFVNYRSFEQDVHSEDYLEPVNMYVVVFREGILSVSYYFLLHYFY